MIPRYFNRTFFNRSWIAAILAASSFSGISIMSTAGHSGTAVSAHADDVEQLMGTMEQVSRDAEAQNEQIKQLEVDLENKQREIDGLRQQVDVATQAANDARNALINSQTEVDKIAGSKYRGAFVDPLTSAMASTDPTAAVDRAAYAEALSRRTEKTISGLVANAQAASETHSKAAAAQAAAEFQANNIRQAQAELQAQQDQLRIKIEEIKTQVDGLNAAQRAQWIARYGPTSTLDLDTLNSENPSGLTALKVAYTKIGSPYSWGAAGPDAFDCSGLVYWAYQQQGKILPRTSQAMMAGGTPVDRNDLQPGDVVGFYPGATHVGIYAGNGLILHASDYGIPVQVVSIDSMPYYGARRY
ncbi:MAG: NlpC/P60 family protein [Corynebacterium sp.]|nr:NlpC/P60 family protein [Corynebacterium sp.]